MSVDVFVSDNHPLALELTSLRNAVAHYQRETHSTALKLQQHSFETSTALQRLLTLEHENAYLRAELDVHRAHPDTLSTLNESGALRDSLHVQELTLALRRLSDKLDLTEKSLLTREEELIAARGEKDVSKRAADNAYAIAVRLRAELETSRAAERELLNRVRAAEEEKKMSDLVVEEYACLVRALEGRSSVSSRDSTKEDGHASKLSLDGLSSARQGLQKLLQDSNLGSEKLHAEIARLHNALELTTANLEAEREAAADDKRQLATMHLELHRLRTDDNAAAKMVSRYMKFSQSSTDILHTAMENMKLRHSATLTSYESRIRQMEDKLSAEGRQSERLRRALDELSEDISREVYGRRREISLRLALLGREQTLSERLKRWLLRAHEALQRADSSSQLEEVGRTFKKILSAAENILVSLGDSSTDNGESKSSLARVIAAHHAVSSLTTELQKETDRRLHLERQLATLQPVVEKPGKVVDVSGKLDIQGNDQRTSMNAKASDSAAEKALPAFPGATYISRPPSYSSAAADNHSLPTQDLLVPANSVTSTIVDVSEVPITPKEPDLIEKASATTSPLLTVTIKGNGSTEALASEQEFDVDSSSHDPSQDSPPGNVKCDPTSLSKLTESSLHLPGQTAAVDKAEFDFRSLSVTNPASSEALSEQSITASTNPSSEIISRTDSAPILSIDCEPAEMASETSTVSLEATKLISTNTVGDSEADSNVQQAHTNPMHENEESEIGSASLAMNTREACFGVPQEEWYRNQIAFPASTSADLGLSFGSAGNGSADTPNSTPESSKILLSKLSHVGSRYDELQRSFRDCHLSLEQLKGSIAAQSGSSSTLQIAIGRLDDYCEDARVELEIRVADEERISKGYQTLISIPGAITDEVNETEMKTRIEAFVDGSDPAVDKALRLMRHKLDDLQHDIASVKRALHDFPAEEDGTGEGEPEEPPARPPSSSWASWTGAILSSSRSPSPAPPPTFGTVITSPHLRHTPSMQRVRVDSNNALNPFASLGLRIPMPSYASPQSPPSPRVQPRMTPRPRVSSTIFSLGLGGGLLPGSRRSSLAFNPQNIPKPMEMNATNLDSEVD